MDIPAFTEQFLRFCNSRRVTPAVSRPQLTREIQEYLALRMAGHPWSTVRKHAATAAVEATDEEWIAWIDTHCTLTDWERELVYPVLGTEEDDDMRRWLDELHAFLPFWIRRPESWA